MSTGATTEQLAQLSAFNPSYHWKVQTANEKGCTCVCFMDARDVQDVLDTAVGPANWQVTYPLRNGQTICALSIFTNGQWVTKEDTGTDSDIEPEKGRVSDAFKRAAVAWGIGRFMYRLPVVRVKSTKNNRGKFVPADDQGNIIWDLTKHIRQRGLDPAFKGPNAVGSQNPPEPQRQAPTANTQQQAAPQPAQPDESAQRMAAAHAVLRLWFLMHPRNHGDVFSADHNFFGSTHKGQKDIFQFLESAPMDEIRDYFKILKAAKSQGIGPEHRGPQMARESLLAQYASQLQKLGLTLTDHDFPLAIEDHLAQLGPQVKADSAAEAPPQQEPAPEESPAKKPGRQKKAPKAEPAAAQPIEPLGPVEQLINICLDLDAAQAVANEGNAEDADRVHDAVYTACIALTRHKQDDINGFISKHSKAILGQRLKRSAKENTITLQQYAEFCAALQKDMEVVIRQLKTALEDDGPPPF